MQVARFLAGSEYVDTPEGLHTNEAGAFLIGGVVPTSDDSVRQMALSGHIEWLTVELAAWAQVRLGLAVAPIASEPVAPEHEEPATRQMLDEPRTSRKPRRLWRLVVVLVAGVILLGVAYAGVRIYSSSAEEAALNGARQAAKRIGEAMVSGDVGSFEENVVSMTDIAVLTAAEIDPELLKSEDGVLVEAFSTTLEARALNNIGQNLVGIDSVEQYAVDREAGMVFFVAGSEEAGKSRVLVFTSDDDVWKMAYWTPPLSNESLADYLTELAEGDGSIPGAAETLKIAGIDYDRTAATATAESSPAEEADATSAAPLSDSAKQYARDLGGKSHMGETLYLILGDEYPDESSAQASLDAAIPLFGDMQSYFIVQKSDNFEPSDPGWFLVVEAYRSKEEAEQNIDFASRGFDGQYPPSVMEVVVRTDDPIPVNYVDVNPTGE